METCFPILDNDLARRIYRDVLQNYLDDNLNAWELQADGRYRQCEPAPGQPPHSAQQTLLEGL
ncbi:polyphosphate kinase [compost metagenome]